MNKELNHIYSYILKGAKISIDSRNIDSDSVFFALKGPVYDANKFVPEALEKGALLAVADGENLPDIPGIIKVNNVLETLQQLAIHHRTGFDIPVIGITGTNGKTTTKELLSSVLASKYNILYTQGNFNNHIGLPLTILSLKKEHEIAVIEMGANRLGDIEFLCKIAQPTCGLITNIGKAHIEGFGSVDNIIKTKTELYRHLKNNNGLIFLNGDNETLKNKVGSYKNVLTYGRQSHFNLSGEIISSQPFLRIAFHSNSGEKQNTESEYIQSKLIGTYNFENILAAVLIGVHFDVSGYEIKTAIESYTPKNSRSQYKESGKNKIVWDAYNANPTSMALALDNFRQLNAKSKIVILGDMLELGSSAAKEHQAIVNNLNEKPFELMILVGEEFYACKPASKNIRTFKTNKEAASWLEKNPLHNYTILVKGSRGIELEALEEFL
ncbi:MAG: UDP-N-acetylmuramoyl-tripeptide--D-alanyl-D-alanine ligase [Bacteroidetes bacterium]|nr:MAG: UDP-N-acetylmuramoyl-tripeptide--D-alanyl-D-alanine ligase [Bacteroidota bacterium]